MRSRAEDWCLASRRVKHPTTGVFGWERDRVFGPLEWGGEFGWRPLESFRLAVGFDAPVVGPDRYSWKANLSAAWTL